MRKRIKITLIILSITIIMAITIYYAYIANTDYPNLFTTISGWISGIATLVIGIITIYLTDKIDKTSKQKDEQRNNELNEQYLNQLRLNANPTIYFESISDMHFYNSSSIISNNESVNRLLNQKANENIISTSGNLSMEIIFNSPKPENIENIYIKNASFVINNEDGFSKYALPFTNFSSNTKANLKYNNLGQLVCHLDLMIIDEDTKEELINQITDIIGKKNSIVIRLDLTASNTLNVQKDYRCGFFLHIIEKTENEYDTTFYKLKLDNNVIWADSVKINI